MDTLEWTVGQTVGPWDAPQDGFFEMDHGIGCGKTGGRGTDVLCGHVLNLSLVRVAMRRGVHTVGVQELKYLTAGQARHAVAVQAPKHVTQYRT